MVSSPRTTSRWRTIWAFNWCLVLWLYLGWIIFKTSHVSGMTLVFYCFLIPLYTSVKDSTYGLSLWVPDPLINRFYYKSFKDVKITSKSLPNIVHILFKSGNRKWNYYYYFINLGQWRKCPIDSNIPNLWYPLSSQLAGCDSFTRFRHCET